MIWAKWRDSGKGIPLNAEPDPELGNLLLHDDGTVEKCTYLAAARERGDDLYVTHFATCPSASTFRKS